MKRSICERLAAAHVDPSSIRRRRACGSEAELLLRSRAPGAVEVPKGQREHLLMCTTGEPVPGSPVRSVVQTPAGERIWRQCPARHISFIPAGVPLSWEWTYRSSSLHLTIAPRFVDEIGAQLSAARDRAHLDPIYRTEDPTLSALLVQLAEESEPRSVEPMGKDLVTSSLIMLVGVQLHRLAHRGGEAATVSQNALESGVGDGPGLPDAVRRRTLQRLHDQMTENVSVAELAADSGYSSWHFARLFKQSTGLPPHQYQLRLRIERAGALLCASPQRSIAQIASELGFADESHFRRHFKRITGQTPTAWRSRRSP